jgi:LysM repeat protein
MATPRVYIVHRGDTLSRIAARFYGSAADWPRLYCAEKKIIPDPNLIYVGQRIFLPHRLPKAGCIGDPPPPHKHRGSFGGTLSCSGLEQLWIYAGGNPAHAFIAAEIAMAESGGYQYAHSPTNDYGYWQINGSWGPVLATYDPWGNAHAAIIISHDGTDWYPWTTYVTGAYIGRC